MQQLKDKPIILILCDFYLPGVLAGGPIRSIANLVDRLGEEFQFKIITRDRDFGNKKAYPDILVDTWVHVGSAEVMYLSPSSLSIMRIKKLLSSTKYHVLYLNSFFSPLFSCQQFLLKRLGLVPNKPYLINPHGEFSAGALKIKRLKKKIYLKVANFFGLYNRAIWQATSDYEETEIRLLFGNEIPVYVAPDLSPVGKADLNLRQLPKKSGYLRVIFLSRISKMKNLDMALQILSQVKANLQFNIYGPIEDGNYWNECQSIIRELPPNIEVVFHGTVEHDEVKEKMAANHLFFLPTRGEGHGHVILEAMTAGCLILISDRTPWRNLTEKEIGWDLPLEQPDKFVEIIEKCVKMDSATFEKWSEKAGDFGIKISADEAIVKKSQLLFKSVSLSYHET